MDQIESAEQPSASVTGAAAQAVQEKKPGTDLNLVAQAPSLKFLVPEFYSKDPDLWFWQLEATFTVNRVTTEKDKYAVVISNLSNLSSAPSRGPWPPRTSGTPFSRNWWSRRWTSLTTRGVRSSTLSQLLETRVPLSSSPQSATCSPCRSVSATSRGTSSSSLHLGLRGR